MKDERLAGLQQLLRAQQDAFNRSALGRVMPVLFQDVGRHGGQIVGRSPYLQAVHAVAPVALLGETVPVRIVDVTANSLKGEIADCAADGMGRSKMEEKACA